jgi:hypothetical protein
VGTVLVALGGSVGVYWAFTEGLGVELPEPSILFLDNLGL